MTRLFSDIPNNRHAPEQIRAELPAIFKKGKTMTNSRFDYVKYDTAAMQLQDEAKDRVKKLEDLIDSVPGKAAGRARALAHTKLEETYMWIGKAIRDEQIERNSSAELQEERKNG